MKIARRMIVMFGALVILIAVFSGCAKKTDNKSGSDETTVISENNDSQDTKDTQTTMQEEVTIERKSLSASTKVGDVVAFGHFTQGNAASEKQPVAWRVLAVEEGKAFLFADKILDSRAYNLQRDAATWETSAIREWLNNDFYNAAFNAEEQMMILTTDVTNEDNLIYESDGGNETKDKIFLLSYSEILNPAYGFSADSDKLDATRIAQGTNFAINNGLTLSEESSSLNNSVWWLRSPGYDQWYAGIVNYDGMVSSSSFYVDSTDVGVRPALWVSF